MKLSFIGYISFDSDYISILAYDEAEDVFRVLEATVENHGSNDQYHRNDSHLETSERIADSHDISNLQYLSFDYSRMDFSDDEIRSYNDIFSCVNSRDRYYPRGSISYSTYSLCHPDVLCDAIINNTNIQLAQSIRKTLPLYSYGTIMSDKGIIDRVKWFIKKGVILLPRKIAPNRIIELEI